MKSYLTLIMVALFATSPAVLAQYGGQEDGASAAGSADTTSAVNVRETDAPADATGATTPVATDSQSQSVTPGGAAGSSSAVSNSTLLTGAGIVAAAGGVIALAVGGGGSDGDDGGNVTTGTTGTTGTQ